MNLIKRLMFLLFLGTVFVGEAVRAGDIKLSDLVIYASDGGAISEYKAKAIDLIRRYHAQTLSTEEVAAIVDFYDEKVRDGTIYGDSLWLGAGNGLVYRHLIGNAFFGSTKCQLTLLNGVYSTVVSGIPEVQNLLKRFDPMTYYDIHESSMAWFSQKDVETTAKYRDPTFSLRQKEIDFLNQSRPSIENNKESRTVTVIIFNKIAYYFLAILADIAQSPRLGETTWKDLPAGVDFLKMMLQGACKP